MLTVDPTHRRLVLTHKKTLVESSLPIITAYDQVQVDMMLHGFIVAVKDFGCLVSFYNDVKGQFTRMAHSQTLWIYYVIQILKQIVQKYPMSCCHRHHQNIAAPNENFCPMQGIEPSPPGLMVSEL